MPRAFSSGALSMESKLRNFTFGLFFARYLVMAAVSVVLPWSMCPIVPTLTCGLLRSNFSLAILFSYAFCSKVLPGLALAPGAIGVALQGLFCQGLRQLLVMVKLHGVNAAALRGRAQV